MKKTPTPSKLASRVLEDSLIWNHERLPFKIKTQESDTALAVLVGDNASGKSLFVQSASAWVKRNLDEGCHVSISIRERTGAGASEISSFRRIAMFGDESENSTGSISSKMIEKGFRNYEGRCTEGSPCLLIFDEPEIGLSERFHFALGQMIGINTKESENLEGAGIFVVTHSRKLVQGIREGLGKEPGAVLLGGYESLHEWEKDDTDLSIDELLNLSKINNERFREVCSIIKDVNRPDYEDSQYAKDSVKKSQAKSTRQENSI